MVSATGVQDGGSITTKFVHIRAWIISRRMSSWLEQQGQRSVMQLAGTLRCVGPPRPGPLLESSRQGQVQQARVAVSS